MKVKVSSREILKAQEKLFSAMPYPNMPEYIEIDAEVVEEKPYSTFEITDKGFQMRKDLPVVERKTYKERAEYLSEVYPMRSDVFQGIAQFFGEDEIPPEFSRITKN
jgi:hypothetical protein